MQRFANSQRLEWTNFDDTHGRLPQLRDLQAIVTYFKRRHSDRSMDGLQMFLCDGEFSLRGGRTSRSPCSRGVTTNRRFAFYAVDRAAEPGPSTIPCDR